MKNVRSAVNEAKYDDSTILSDSELGDIKIHDGVIAALARRAALGVEGVSRLAGSQFVDNLAEIVGSRRMQARAINVTVDEETRITIEIKLNLV
ncbi:MAG: Asp23/Gls24 family envelope stress response protein, partial [Lentisphaeria bacterium]|nr:Asp23/Gls24 family envelope stress response protein [Lentisphaeria bacterium]